MCRFSWKLKCLGCSDFIGLKAKVFGCSGFQGLVVGFNFGFGKVWTKYCKMQCASMQNNVQNK